jgi:putative ABC transport system substrate-binding protein
MSETIWRRFRSHSDNPKSKTCTELSRSIENPKWWGIFAIAFAVAFGGVEAHAQQPKKIFRIGYLSSRDEAGESTRAGAIRLALRALGYVEGQNIAFEHRYAAGKLDRHPELAAELVRLKVDLIVAGGDPPIRAAMNATNSIPIIMIGPGLDPVEAGYVKSLAHPGGNVTGLTNLARDLGGKRLELLKEAVPKISRVAVLYEANPSSLRELKDELPATARALKLTLQPWEMREGESFERVFSAPHKERPDGLYLLGGSLINNNQNQIARLAIKNRLPSVYQSRVAVDGGILMSYGVDQAASYRRVAYYIDRIFKGAKPADLPVEQPMKFEFVINLKTAKQIGVTIPPDLLARATKIIR